MTRHKERCPIIAAYRPNEDGKAEEKDEFWDNLNLATENSIGKIYASGNFNEWRKGMHIQG